MEALRLHLSHEPAWPAFVDAMVGQAHKCSAPSDGTVFLCMGETRAFVAELFQIIRGFERKKIFSDDEDRDDFLARLGRIVSETSTNMLSR
jgi:hypothetical protein